VSRPPIEVRHVSKAFRVPHERTTTLKELFLHPLRRSSSDQNHALDDISFDVPSGEFLGIVGPNGSGKSTLLRILAGIYRADRGAVSIDGALSPFIELGVGFSTDLSARDNIWINGTLLGLREHEIKQKFDSILEFAELERFVDLKLKNYSSGMLLRLAYSIAIQVPFDILLLDEVLAVGDERFQQKCFGTFERFRLEGKTIVFVSHDLDAVTQNCDRVLLLEHGRISEIGDPDDVVARYRRLERIER